MEICVKKFLVFSYFFLFLVFNHDLLYPLVLPMSQPNTQTQQLMTLQMMSLIEYLIQTYDILVVI